ncbi:RAD55 family ATPase [Thermoproteus tenax]|uniref:RecA-superfamily ATPase n=1 Tax=Thermoproteus tenax (strain ATCC 35583 / DSM 2078 / JCM 9277 / NBRC 100435 / Kra 1) TaxID=768679 RepID=G4RNJ3_THETK|nr:ATPase AAA [Thermoproteus tenax]CCC81137.1 RecA-superfamily ATPase [Thermoproteus tenax Kra 1]
MDFAPYLLKGMTLVYGPPGSGKTSFVVRLALLARKKVLWISTSDSEEFFRAVLRRLNAPEEKFEFYHFPRALRENITKYAMEKGEDYGMVVVDPLNGIISREEDPTSFVHTTLYQLSMDVPVVVTLEGGPGRLPYIADHVVKVWYKVNSVGHVIRYIQLTKSRSAPPSPRYLFDIIEGRGLAYVKPVEKVLAQNEEYKVDERLGVPVFKGAMIGVFSDDESKVSEKVQPFLDDEKSYLLVISPFSISRRLRVPPERAVVAASFNDLMRFYSRVVTGEVEPRYLVVTGLLPVEKLSPGEAADYILVLGPMSVKAELTLVADVANPEEVRKNYVYQAMNQNIVV